MLVYLLLLSESYTPALFGGMRETEGKMTEHIMEHCDRGTSSVVVSCADLLV